MLDLNSVNEHGVPLHACNSYRCDEHYWAWRAHMNRTGVGPWFDWLRSLASGRQP